MGRPKKDPADKLTPHTVYLGKRELQIVQRLMNELGYEKSAAIRSIIRRSGRGPATSPFTRIEGTDDD